MAQIRKPSEPLNIHTVSALIYGEVGIGKTTLGLTAPNPLLIDCESGIRRVDPRLRTDFVSVETWQDILDVTKDGIPYDTVILDTVSSALGYLADSIIKKNPKMENRISGGLTLQGYGALLSSFTTYVQSLQRQNKNLVFISHMREIIEDERRMFRPDIVGRNLGSMLRVMDLCGYMYARKGGREISFTPSDTFYAKNTAQLEDQIAIPELKDSRIRPLTEIFNKFFDKQKEQETILKDYRELMKVIDELINSIANAETANEVFPQLASLDAIWDSKIIARDKLKSKIEELELRFNKTKAKYE